MMLNLILVFEPQWKHNKHSCTLNTMGIHSLSEPYKDVVWLSTRWYERSINNLQKKIYNIYRQQIGRHWCWCVYGLTIVM